ncbi:hypothetical protein QTP88_018819 [Uroleucon formosanum]
MALKNNLRENIYLIGCITNQIIGCKLPSNRQVLSVLFFNLRKVNLNLHDSAALVIRETCIFWDKARIPTRDFQHCSKKLKLIYEEWRKLQKNSTRKTATQKKNENNFLEKLEELFDIAHLNALDIIKIDEDRQFLLLQRQPGRPGHMSGVDYKLSKKEDGALNKLEELQKKRKRADDEFMLKNQRIELQSSSDSENEELQSNNEIHYKNKEPLSISSGPKIRASREFITTKLAAALDKCKITDREAVHLLISTVEALGLDVNDFIINRSSIHRYRERFRSEFNKELRKSFSQPLTAAVVHWDGKILPALTGNEYVDRLPVLITNNNSEYLLGVPKLESATGKEQAQAIFHALQDWGIKDSVKAICCDTTASNTGRLNGACVLLEQLLEKDLLYLPCRHHISEVILKSVFDVKFGSTSGPNVPIFKRFKEYWSKIDTTKFKSGIDIMQSRKLLDDEVDTVLSFTLNCLKVQQCREDYRELLELTVIFLGGIPVRGISFRVPGAIHHARWMSKAIYSLKICLFSEQFKLNSKEKNIIYDICIFIVRIYVKYWFSSPVAAFAPSLDLELFKNLILYKKIDPDISNITIKKLSGHLWYLTSETAALSFFDKNVSIESKIKMVQSIKNNNCDTEETKRLNIQNYNIQNILEKKIENFITVDSLKFFTRFNLSTNFLDLEPQLWDTDENYKIGFHMVQQLKVVNDTAERSIKLIEDYNSIITKNEDQKQFLLQVVRNYRQKYPDSKKSTLLQPY